MNHTRLMVSAFTVTLFLSGCGVSESERQEIASVTCSLFASSRNFQSTYRLEKMNEARDAMGEPAFLGSDDEIKAALQIGLCEKLVSNDPTYYDDLEEFLAEREERRKIAEAQREEEARLYLIAERERKIAEQKAREEKIKKIDEAYKQWRNDVIERIGKVNLLAHFRGGAEFDYWNNVRVNVTPLVSSKTECEKFEDYRTDFIVKFIDGTTVETNSNCGSLGLSNAINAGDPSYLKSPDKSAFRDTMKKLAESGGSIHDLIESAVIRVNGVQWTDNGAPNASDYVPLREAGVDIEFDNLRDPVFYDVELVSKDELMRVRNCPTIDEPFSKC